MPAPRDLPQKVPAPVEKLGCKSPKVGANFQSKSLGVRGGMVVAKLDGCINSAYILNFSDANEILRHFITPLFHYSIILLDCWTVGTVDQKTG